MLATANGKVLNLIAEIHAEVLFIFCDISSYYILSGTMIPNKPIASLIVLAIWAEKATLNFI